MTDLADQQFRQFLKVPPAKRSNVENRYISYFLQQVPHLANQRPEVLETLGRTVYYDWRDKNDMVYNATDFAHCWYVLLTGCVWLDTPVGFTCLEPYSPFGMKSGDSDDGRRGYACTAVMFSEFIVFDFANINIQAYARADLASQFRANGRRNPPPSYNKVSSNIPAIKASPPTLSSKLKTDAYLSQSFYEQAKMPVNAGAYLNLESMTSSWGSKPLLPPPAQLWAKNRPPSYSNRLSISSNGSSFQTSDGDSVGSNTRLDEENHIYSQLSKPTEVVHYCSPPEEEIYSEIGNFERCFDELKILKRAPCDRTPMDVNLLADFLQHFSAFSSMSDEMRFDFSKVMKYDHVEQKNKIILQNAEQLDSWCVVINGQVVNIKEDGSRRLFSTGQSFGLDRKKAVPQFHVGNMITMERDCQFVAIPQKEYLEVVEKHSQYERVVYVDNRTVLVTEARDPTEKIDEESHVVKLGEPARLVSHLVEDHSASETSYVEDFLLTYRTFIQDPTFVSEKLEKWYSDHSVSCMKDRITKVVFSWVSHHYIDFESNSSLSYFLEKFYDRLVHEGRMKEISNLVKICSKKGKVRKIELDSVMRRDELPFNLLTPLGGKGTFIKTFKSKVEGLKVGDQIIAVNNKNVEDTSLKDTVSFIASHEYCWLTVKHNVLGMKRSITKQTSLPTEVSPMGQQQFVMESHHKNNSGRVAPVINGFVDVNTSGKNVDRSKLKKMAKKFAFLPPNPLTKRFHSSTSNPDVSNLKEPSKTDESCDFALKIYNVDQGYKYLSFSDLSSIRHIVNKAVEAFEFENEQEFVLCHVQVSSDGMVKQTRLSEQHDDIVDRIRPACRFYIKKSHKSERLLPLESVTELQKEANVQFLDLKPLELAIQLTLRDLAVVQKILPHQYVEMLWKVPPKDCKYLSYTSIDDFVDLSNKEMFWVMHTVCSEKNLNRRAKIVKQFIKIAKFCRELRNFNSMFAILSGLGNSCVSRLEYTWEKVPSRECKLKFVLDEVMDPSRNMAKYRNLLAAYKGSSPVIPIFPIFIKDLTVFHLGNESKIDDLINFEKLRLISREIKCFYTSISSNPDRDFLKSLITKPNKAAAQMAPAETQNESLEFSKSVSDIAAAAAAPIQRNGFLHKSRKSLLLLNNNPKKIYEELVMCKRVEQYIKNLSILTDEEQLRKMSRSCEPDEQSEFGPVSPPPSSSKTSEVIKDTAAATGSNAGSVKSSPQITSSVNNDRPMYDVVSPEDPATTSMSNPYSSKETYSPIMNDINSSLMSASPSSSQKSESAHQAQYVPMGIASWESSMLDFARAANSKYISAEPSTSANLSQNRDSVSSSSSSSSRSKSVSRIDDKFMRIPATPAFATNKQIPVKHSNGVSPPICSSSASVSPNSGKQWKRLQQDANSASPASVHQSYPQGASASAVHSSNPQISFARSMTLVSKTTSPVSPASSSSSTSAAVPLRSNSPSIPPRLQFSSAGALKSPLMQWPPDKSLNL